MVERTKIGKNTIIYHPELINLYGCSIGDNCKIASFVEIQRDVVIGNNVKIEAFAFIPTGVEIEDGVFIGPHVCFTNDLYPKSLKIDGTLSQPGDWIVIKTLIKKGASIGANCTIICGIQIGKYAMIGAGSVVTKNIPANVLAYGNPARVIKTL